MFSIPQFLQLGVAVLCLSGCATRPPSATVATDQEQNDAMKDLISCLHSAAKKLDDNKSPASTIALGMRPLCASEFASSREVYGRNLNPTARRIYDRKDQESYMQIATTAVLDERAKRR